MDEEVREFSTDNNLRKYQSKFLQMCQNCVMNNESSETDFRVLIGSFLNLECASEEIVGGIFNELTSKLANTRINEFLNAKNERDLKMQGKVVDTDEMLRPKLKSYALVSKQSLSSLTNRASQVKASHHVSLLQYYDQISMAHCWLRPLFW